MLYPLNQEERKDLDPPPDPVIRPFHPSPPTGVPKVEGDEPPVRELPASTYLPASG
jgi:hypothetical protein